MSSELGPGPGDVPNFGNVPGEIAKPPGGGSLGKRPEGAGIADKAPGKYGWRDSADRVRDTSQPQKETGATQKETQGQPEERKTTIPQKGEVFVAGHPSEPQQTQESREGTERSERRRELTLAEVGEILAATGNNEAKAIFLSAMVEARVYTQKVAEELMQSVQKGYSRGESIRGEDLIQYCEHSLEPVGLVVPRKSAGPVGFVKTEKGFDLDAFHGQLLYFSEQDPDRSLADVFPVAKSVVREGAEGEKKEPTNPPLLRFRILQQLVGETPPTKKRDLVQSFDESPAVIGSHLKKLSEKGYIQYQSSQSSDPSQDEYTITKVTPEEKVPPLAHEITLTQDVYDLVKESGTIRTEDVYANLKRADQDKGGKPRALNMRRVSAVLRHLEREGYLEGTHAGQSEISLTLQQREVLSELVGIVEKFQKGDDDDFFEEGRRKARDIISNPKRAAALLHKAQERSKRVKPEVTMAQIEAILAEAPADGFTKDEIHQALQAGGNNLSGDSVKNIMTQMRYDNKAAIVKQEGRTNFYGPMPQETPLEPDQSALDL